MLTFHNSARHNREGYGDRPPRQNGLVPPPPNRRLGDEMKSWILLLVLGVLLSVSATSHAEIMNVLVAKETRR